MGNEKAKKEKVGNDFENRKHRIKTEVKKCEKIMGRLLQRHRNGKPGGLKDGGERHDKLKAHIENLMGKL